MGFLDIRILDIIDILLVAFVLYHLYNLIKGTTAMYIFSGILFLYLLWWTTMALEMQLFSTILGQIMGVGVIALLIVFQQEIRRFFLVIGRKYFSGFDINLEDLLANFIKKPQGVKIYAIAKACMNLAATKTGGLIVIAKQSELNDIIATGRSINADTSSELLENIFFKNSPLHDGAVVITRNKIIAARCVLPVSEKRTLPNQYGMRHRAAMGLSEINDAFILVISEETGRISIVKDGVIKNDITLNELRKALEKEFATPEEPVGQRIWQSLTAKFPKN